MMGLFSYSLREGKGVSKDAPLPPKPALYSRRFFSNFLNILKLNMIFIVFCLPVVTIGPAISGMTYVLSHFLRGEPVFLFSDFFEYFKKTFWKSFFLSLIDGLILYSILIGILNKNMGNMVIPITVSGIVILFMNFYFFNLNNTYQLSFFKLLHFSFLLAVGNLPFNLLAGLVVGLVGFVLLRVNVVIVILLLIVILPVVLNYLVLCFTDDRARKIMDKYVGSERAS